MQILLSDSWEGKKIIYISTFNDENGFIEWMEKESICWVGANAYVECDDARKYRSKSEMWNSGCGPTNFLLKQIIFALDFFLYVFFSSLFLTMVKRKIISIIKPKGNILCWNESKVCTKSTEPIDFFFKNSHKTVDWNWIYYAGIKWTLFFSESVQIKCFFFPCAYYRNQFRAFPFHKSALNGFRWAFLDFLIPNQRPWIETMSSLGRKKNTHNEKKKRKNKPFRPGRKCCDCFAKNALQMSTE